ncbi:MAG: response regulator transcription factor [Tessaracoccus sp.]
MALTEPVSERCFPEDEPHGVPEQIRVLIVDDEALMRAGIRLMVDGVDGISVVGEADDGIGALDVAQRLDPDVILMDIRMPRMNGIEAIRALHASGSTARIIVLTAFDTDDFLLDALRGGALSFLLKDATPELIVGSILDAAAGRSRVSPTALTRLINLATQPDAPAEPTPVPPLAPAPKESSPPEWVTVREWEVGRLVAQGLTNAEIADALYLSQTTVKTHLASLFAKLHVTNRVQLAIRVLEHP